MNKIITPDGVILNLGVWKIEDCEIIYDDQQSEDELREELFKNTGILVGEMKGGETDG